MSDSAKNTAEQTNSRPKDPGRDRELRKAIDKYERQLGKVDGEIAAVHADMAAISDDFTRMGELDAKLRELNVKREGIEEQWLEAATELAE